MSCSTRRLPKCYRSPLLLYGNFIAFIFAALDVLFVIDGLSRYNVSAPAITGNAYSVFVSAWDHWTGQYSQEFQSVPQTVLLQASAITSIEGGDRISSVGGQVRLYGTNFGSLDSVVSAMFFNESSGTKYAICRSSVGYIDCEAQQGVGRNYTWVLVVDGFVGNTSTVMTHYAPPAVRDLTGPGQLSSTRYVCVMFCPLCRMCWILMSCCVLLVAALWCTCSGRTLGLLAL